MNTIYPGRDGDPHRATFIDTWALLADADGEYADKLVPDAEGEDDGAGRKQVRVRAGDGIHLSPAGAHRLEAHVLRTLLPALENA